MPRFAVLSISIALCVVAALLRFLPLSESLWLDELHTAWCAVGTLTEVAERASIGNQSPLYFWFEWFLVTFLGASEFTLRLPSFLAGSLLPLACFLVARRWQAEAAGLVAAGLMALDPHAIFYATEARPYAIVQLLGVIHIGLTLELSQQPNLLWRSCWIVVAAILFHLHYTSALFIAAECLFLFAVVGREPHRHLARLLDATIVGLLCLPALGNLQAIFARRTNWAAFIPRDPLWEAIDWTPLPGVDKPGGGTGFWWWLVLLVVLVVEILWTYKTKPIARLLPVTRLASLVIGGIAIPVFVAWLATWSDIARLFFPRYLAAVLPLTALLAGFCIFAAPFPWQRLVLGSLTIGVSLWSTGMAQQLWHEGRPIAPRGEDWRGCIAWLNEQLQTSQQPVLVWSGLIESNALDEPHDELLDEYCKLPLTALYEINIEPSEIFPLSLRHPGQLGPVAESLIVHRGGAWLVVRGKRKVAEQIGNAVIAGLEKSAGPEVSMRFRIGEQQSFGDVHALHLKPIDHP